MAEVFIVDAIRTPMGRRHGGLSAFHPADLAGSMLEALVDRAGIDPKAIDDVIIGCISQIGAQAFNLARTAWLSVGLPESVPGVTIDRQCGSSQQAIHFAAQGILAGSYELAIAGGVEVMSLVPLNSSGELGPQLGLRYPFDGDGWVNRYGPAKVHQFAAVERIVDKWSLTRTEMEDFALQSNRRAQQAWERGDFDREVLAVNHLTNDETIRTNTSKEKMAGLAPIIDGGLVTAATSSQLADAASVVLLASEQALKQYDLTPRARIHAMAVVGSDPTLMLTGPIPATERVLALSGLSITDIDLFECNEAFAAIPLVWARETGADLSVTNVDGGAIALGHALGATGARLMTTLLHALEARDGRYGLEVICEGGGLANATIVERL